MLKLPQGRILDGLEKEMKAPVWVRPMSHIDAVWCLEAARLAPPPRIPSPLSLIASGVIFQNAANLSNSCPWIFRYRIGILCRCYSDERSPPRREASVSITTSRTSLILWCPWVSPFMSPRKRMAELVGCAKEWFSFVLVKKKKTQIQARWRENGKDKRVCD